MGDDAVEVRIERLLAGRYPSGMTALEIRRGLGVNSATKKDINRILYHSIAAKGMASMKEGTPPCWTATDALMAKLSSTGQAAQSTSSQVPVATSQAMGAVAGAVQNGAVDASRGQTAGTPQQNWNGGTQVMPYNPNMAAGHALQPTGAMPMNLPGQQPTMQVMQTAVGVVQPCNHVHVVPGVLAFPTTGGVCYACQAEQAAARHNHGTRSPPSTGSAMTQNGVHANQPIMRYNGGGQHVPQRPCGQSHHFQAAAQNFGTGGLHGAMQAMSIGPTQGGVPDPRQPQQQRAPGFAMYQPHSQQLPYGNGSNMVNGGGGGAPGVVLPPQPPYHGGGVNAPGNGTCTEGSKGTPSLSRAALHGSAPERQGIAGESGKDGNRAATGVHGCGNGGLGQTSMQAGCVSGQR